MLLAGLLAALAVAVSCGRERETPPSFGLRLFEILVDSESAGELVSGEGRKLEVPATVLVDGEEHKASVRHAGVSGISQPKKSFELDFGSSGFEGSRKLRLAANAGDPSQLRAPLSMDIFLLAGLPSPQWEFVSVYLNKRFLGLYLRMEKVDEDFFRFRNIPWVRRFQAEDGADFQPDMPARIGDAFTVKPKGEGVEKMAELGRIAAIEDDEEFLRRIFSRLRRESALAYLTAAQLTNHFDGFNKNLHYVERSDNGLMEVVPWDFDLDWRYDLSPDLEAAHRNRLWSRLSHSPEVKAEVLKRVRELSQGKASMEWARARVAELAARIDKAWEMDPFLGGSGRSLEEGTQELLRAIDERYRQVQ